MRACRTAMTDIRVTEGGPRPDKSLRLRAWRDQHILVISESDDRLDFVEREIVRRIGERLYGGMRHG